MNKQVCYGDQVYIEISNLLPPPNTDTRILFSNSFLEDSVFGVKAHNYAKTNFRSCIFTVLPSLVDSKEDINTLNSLGAELSFLAASKPNTVGQKYLQNEIKHKEEQVSLTKEALEALNKKILKEMDNNNVCFGDVILLQHSESGYYLSADSSNHPQNPKFYNLRLKKERSAGCYFRFFSYTVPSDRGPLDYDCETKLVSVHLNTVLTMSENKLFETLDLGNEDDAERQNLSNPVFPADLSRRENPIKTFNAEPFVIGTTLDSNDNNKIRLGEYCTRTDLLAFNKRKAIKNGDYIRLQLDDFYLTASKSVYRQTFGLLNQKTDGYKYSLINTIFQVAKAQEEDEEYPKGSEVQSSAKRMDDQTEIEKYYLRHIVTGQYLSIPKNELYEVGVDNYDMEEKPAETAEPPFFVLVNSFPKNQKSIVTRNSRISLKSFTSKDDEGEFYLESELEKYKILQFDLNSTYFVGFKNPEDKIKDKLKLVKKYIVGNQVVGSSFKVNLVNEEELRKFLEFESYANALKRFMRVLQCIFTTNGKINSEIFANELSKILKCSQQLMQFLKKEDNQVQILAREFRILDMSTRILYYFFTSHQISTLLDYIVKFEKDQVIQLLTNLSQFVLNAAKRNDLTHIYIAQYVRVFINSMINPSSYLKECNKKDEKILKDSIIALLKMLLWDKDMDTLGQLVYYEASIFSCLDSHSDYSTHLLKMMDHYSQSKSPNLVNTLRTNFISKFLSEEEKLKKIFPKLIYLSSENDIELNFTRDGYANTMKISEAPKEVIKYLKWVFKLINSVASESSLQFARIMIEFYDEQLCENIVHCNKVPSKIKNEILLMTRLVHFAYNKLPFDTIPPKIQLMLPKIKLDNAMTTFNSIISEAKNNLISGFELGVMESARTTPKSVGKISLQQLSLEILRNEFSNIKKGDLLELPFILQVMSSLMENEENLPSESLYIIYHSLAFITDNASQELSSKKLGPFTKPFSENAEKIFAVLSSVDNYMVKLAFKEGINNIKDKVLLVRQGVTPLQTIALSNQMVVASSSIASLEGEIMEAIKHVMSEEWKSKKKLYQMVGKDNADQYSEKRLMEALWKIVESDDLTLTNSTVHLIKNKTNFENNVTKELFESALIIDEMEADKFMKLMKSLLNLNRINRRIKTIKEFKLPEREDDKTLDEIIEYLEEILTIMYDYKLHMEEEESALNEEQAKTVFLQRFRYSKTQAKMELPFRYKASCVKVFSQRIFKELKGYEILIPFINHFTYKEEFKNLTESKVKLAITLTMNNIVLFEYNNSSNQTILSSCNPFVTLFYKQPVINMTPEAINMFTEMCRGNRRLLKLSEDWLFKVFAYTFVNYLNPLSINQRQGNANSSLPINYMRSLPVLFTTDIPKDMFNAAEIMTSKFDDFYAFMVRDDRLALKKLIQEREDVAVSQTLSEIAKTSEQDFTSLILINMPIFYTIMKEFLEAEVAFALTENKERVLVLQNALTLDKIMPFLTNVNIKYNFELKHLTLRMLENLYFKNVHKNTNIFLNQDDFMAFTNVLLVDVYAYFKNRLNESDPILNNFKGQFLQNEANKKLVDDYHELLRTNLDKITFLQYQSLVKSKMIWKEYIYYILCNFFGNLITYFKNFVLSSQNKEKGCKNTFEIWFDLLMKLRDLDQDPTYISRINEALKDAIIHSEYAEYRNTIYSALGSSGKVLHTSSIKIEDNLKHWKPDLQDLITKYLGQKSKYKHRYAESNLRDIALTLGTNTFVLKKLIYALTIPDTTDKDTIFILKLLRKLVEVENKGLSNEHEPIYKWSDVSPLEFKRIRRKQAILDDLDIVDALFSLMYQHQYNQRVFIEVLFLCIAILYGGNKAVQDSFYIQFTQDYDNEIMDHLSQVLDNTLEVFRTREAQKTKTTYFKTLRYIFDYFLDHPEAPAHLDGDLVQIPEGLKKEIAYDYSLRRKVETQYRVDLQNRTLLLTILKFFQCLCEGHYLNFQEFLRDQTLVEHSKSSNIPEFLRQAYHTYYKEINIENAEVGTQIISLLIEMEQGESQPNVSLLLRKTFISDLCNTLNNFNADLDLLSRGFGFDANHPEFMEIKSKNLVMLKDLVERADPAELKEMKQYINLRALILTFKQNLIAFQKTKGRYPKKKNLLAEDIWDPNLSNAFMIYFILRHLSFEETTEIFSPEIREMIEELVEDDKGINRLIAREYMNVFFPQYCGSIEILKKKTNKVLRIYFPISVLFSYLKPETRDEFANKIDRSNTQTKIDGLIDASEELIAQTTSEYNARNRLFGLNFNVAYSWLRLLTNMIGLTVVLFNIFTLEWFPEENTMRYMTEEQESIQHGLNGAQAGISFILIFLWLQTKVRPYLAFKWNEYVGDNIKENGPLTQDMQHKIDQEQITEEIGEAVLHLKGPYSEQWESVKHIMGKKRALSDLYFILQSPHLLWHLVYFGICVGSGFHPLVTSFQLFDIVIRNDTVNRIALAVSRNARQFLWTIVLLLTTVYVYSVIGMYFLHSRYDDGDVGDLCTDAYSCFLSSLNQGLRSGGGMADALQKLTYSHEEKWKYFGHTIFDLTFFILIIIILLNLIFGMIIDAFGDLRDEKNQNEDDKKNCCFICGLTRSEYERTANFDKHTIVEHNMWQYIAYIIFITEKKKHFSTDLNDIEDYVLDRYLKKDHTWLPVGRSLTLERHFEKEEKEKRTEVEVLRDDVLDAIKNLTIQNKYVITKLNEACGNIIQNKKKTSRNAQPAAHQNLIDRLISKS